MQPFSLQDIPGAVASFVVRAAVPGDVGALARLVALLASHHGDRATVDQDTLHADLFASPSWATALVADRAGVILGYALLVRFYQAQFATRLMDLHHLFVVAEARGNGLGAALTRAAAAEAAAQGCAQLLVGTHPDNHQAQEFYQALGFEKAAFFGPRFRLRLRASS